VQVAIKNGLPVKANAALLKFKVRTSANDNKFQNRTHTQKNSECWSDEAHAKWNLWNV